MIELFNTTKLDVMKAARSIAVLNRQEAVAVTETEATIDFVTNQIEVKAA